MSSDGNNEQKGTFAPMASVKVRQNKFSNLLQQFQQSSVSEPPIRPSPISRPTSGFFQNRPTSTTSTNSTPAFNRTTSAPNPHISPASSPSFASKTSPKSNSSFNQKLEEAIKNNPREKVSQQQESESDQDSEDDGEELKKVEEESEYEKNQIKARIPSKISEDEDEDDETEEEEVEEVVEVKPMPVKSQPKPSKSFNGRAVSKIPASKLNQISAVLVPKVPETPKFIRIDLQLPVESIKEYERTIIENKFEKFERVADQHYKLNVNLKEAINCSKLIEGYLEGIISLGDSDHESGEYSEFDPDDEEEEEEGGNNDRADYQNGFENSQDDSQDEFDSDFKPMESVNIRRDFPASPEEFLAILKADPEENKEVFFKCYELLKSHKEFNDDFREQLYNYSEKFSQSQMDTYLKKTGQKEENQLYQIVELFITLMNDFHDILRSETFVDSLLMELNSFYNHKASEQIVSYLRRYFDPNHQNQDFQQTNQIFSQKLFRLLTNICLILDEMSNKGQSFAGDIRRDIRKSITNVNDHVNEGEKYTYFSKFKDGLGKLNDRQFPPLRNSNKILAELPVLVKSRSRIDKMTRKEKKFRAEKRIFNLFLFQDRLVITRTMSDAEHKILIGIDLDHVECDHVYYSNGNLIEGRCLNPEALESLLCEDEIYLKFEYPLEDRSFDERFLLEIQTKPETKPSIGALKENYYAAQCMVKSSRKFMERFITARNSDDCKTNEKDGSRFSYSYENFARPGTLYN